jgi:phosphoglycerol transferase MdoB-like AlkP superfamily enzyme
MLKLRNIVYIFLSSLIFIFSTLRGNVGNPIFNDVSNIARLLIPAMITVLVFNQVKLIKNNGSRHFGYFLIGAFIVNLTTIILRLSVDFSAFSKSEILQGLLPYHNPVFLSVFFVGLGWILSILIKKITLPVYFQTLKFSALVWGVGTLVAVIFFNHPNLVALFWMLLATILANIQTETELPPFVKFITWGLILVVIAIGNVDLIPAHTNITANFLPLLGLITIASLRAKADYSATTLNNGLLYLGIAECGKNLAEMMSFYTKNYFSADKDPIMMVFFWALLLLIGSLIYSIAKMVASFEFHQSSKATMFYLGSMVVIGLSIVIYLSSFTGDNILNTIIAQQRYHNVLMIFGTLILMFWYLILLGVINRFWIATVLFTSVGVAFAFANYQKMLYRNEPLIWPDLAMVKSLPDIVQMVDVKTVLLLVFAIVAAIVIAILVQRKFLSGKVFHLPMRMLVILGAGLILFGFAKAENQMNLTAWAGKDSKSNSNDNVIIRLFSGVGYKAHPESMGVYAKKFGSMIIFTSTEIVKTMSEPDGYSQAKVDSVVKKYEQVSHHINENRANNDIDQQTVVYILSESYADPSRVPTVKLSSDPMPYVKEVKKENTSGLMYSSGYGGGTANIEFETLTGMSMNNFDPSLVTPYVFLVPKVKNLPNITNLFKTKNAIHPYTSTTYNRGKVFKDFGFQSFKTLDNNNIDYKKRLGKSAYVSDQSAFDQTLKQIESAKGGQFIQLSTMQNHMPYKYGTYSENNYTVSGALNTGAKKAVASYSQGVSYTDEALKNFLNKIDSMDKKVTVVFYGDHLPGIYDGKLNDSKNADAKLHQTDYFIHSNFKTTKVKNTKVVSPNMFTPMVMEQLGEKVSPFYALMTKVQQNVPAAERNKFMDANGNYISYDKFSKKEKEIYNDYKLIQYDITAGKQYSLKHKDFIK